jgi:hypothetical protein
MIYSPKPFHTEMTEWLLDHDDAALWASPGLGKTAVTLSAISRLILEGGSKGALVIAPIRVTLISWPDQVERWDHLRWMRVANLRTEEGIQAWEEGSADIYLINPEKLPSLERTVRGKVHRTPGIVERLIKGRKEIPVDTIVIDEISLFKGGGVRAKAIAPFLHDITAADGTVRYKTPFKRRWGLTGTPAPNSYLDLFHQIKLLDGGKRLGRSITHYKQTHFSSDYMGWKWEIKEGAKEQIDARLADLALVMLGEDYLDVPPCTYEDVDVSLPPKVLKQYRELEKEFLLELENGEIEALSAAALTTKLLQITAGCVFDAEKDTHILHDAKIKELEKLAKKHKGEPLLVLTSYTHERQRILAAFPKARKFHEDDMDDWKAGKIPMWVADYRSLSHGIDGLQDGGRIAVWATPSYSWEGVTQTNARLRRTGQAHETLVYYLLAKDTIDWAVRSVLDSKEEGHNGLMQAVKNLQRLRK